VTIILILKHSWNSSPPHCCIGSNVVEIGKLNFTVFTAGRIQKCVDDLNLHSYSNLALWVRKLDERVEVKLSARLEAALLAWNGVGTLKRCLLLNE